MSDIIVPIDCSNVRDVIPPGQDIILSALAKCSGSSGNTTISWATHILFTSNGIAFERPERFDKKSNHFNTYVKWEEISVISSIIRGPLVGVGLSVYKMNISLIRDEEVETKEQFKERIIAFIAKYRPLLIEKKEKYLEELLQDPKKNKKQIKTQQKDLFKLKKLEEKRLKKKK